MHPREPGERSLGFLEVGSLSLGVVCADAMVKTAAVRLSLLAPVSGGRMLVAVDGDVAPVESALARGIETAGSDLRDALFIADLHPDVPTALAPADRREVGESLGLVETVTAAAAIRAADAARKAAEIRLVRLRLAFGIGGKGFLQITGRVAAVEAGVAAATQAVDFPEFLLRTDVIPSVHADLKRWLGRELRHDGLPFDPIPGD
jgi:microcompartment protein CcmL/EutN